MPTPRRRYRHLQDRYAAAVARACAAEGVKTGPLTRQPLRPFRYMAAIDPSPNKAYLQRVLLWYLAGGFRIEDARTVRRTLLEFRKIVRRLPVEARDVNRYASPGDVAAALARFNGENAEISIDEVPEAILRDSRITARGEDWTLIEIASYPAAAWWAKPTSWCTRELKTYESYAHASPLRIMLTSSGRVQFHAMTDQIMDRFDRPVTPQAAGWSKEACDAAAAAVAEDIARPIPGAEPLQVVEITGEKSILHLLAGFPAPRMREPWNSLHGHFGDNVTSWLTMDDGALDLIALSAGALHVRRLRSADGNGAEPGLRVYRNKEGWRRAPPADRRALRSLVRSVNGSVGIPVRGALEIFALVREDRDLAGRVLAGGGPGDCATLERRIDVLACAAAFPDVLGGAVAELAEELTSQGMADAVATSLTAIFGRGKPAVEAVIARATPAARRLIDAVSPVWLDVHPLTWSETRHPGEPASKATDAQLEEHFSPEGVAARMMPYRFVGRSERAEASFDDLVEVMDRIRDAVGAGYRHVQRGYLAAALPPEGRDEALYVRLLDGGHRGLLAAAPIERLPPYLLRELALREDTPVVLDAGMLTEAAALTLGGMRGLFWDDPRPFPPTEDTPARRAMAAFAAAFLRHRRADWAYVFVRAHALAFGRYDAAPRRGCARTDGTPTATTNPRSACCCSPIRRWPRRRRKPVPSDVRCAKGPGSTRSTTSAPSCSPATGASSAT